MSWNIFSRYFDTLLYVRIYGKLASPYYLNLPDVACADNQRSEFIQYEVVEKSNG